jgi:electron transfer flavoprotein-quinone oxidoreductase
MAKNAVNVVLLERGDYPGSKNMFGGVIYSLPTAEICPEFWHEAPLERAVTKDMIWLLDIDSAVETAFHGLRYAGAPYNKFTALRPNFDRWLAGKAENAGARLINAALVKDLLYEKTRAGRKRVRGVILDDGTRIGADVVVLAEGALAALTRKAGLAPARSARQFSLWIREVVSLPPGKIEERFMLEEGEGAVLAMIGFPSGQASGLAGIFTNKDSLSLTIGMKLDRLSTLDAGLPELLTRLKSHPLVSRLLSGGKSVAYAAHLIPEGGYDTMPRLHSDGVMVVGDAAVLLYGRRGSDLAMLSGKMAAEAVVQARARRDYSAVLLKTYTHKIVKSFFYQNIKGVTKAKRYDARYGDAGYLLNTAANALAYEIFHAGMETDKERIKKLSGILAGKQPLTKTLPDLIAGLRNWRVL